MECSSQKPMLGSPPLSKRQRHSEASLLASRPLQCSPHAPPQHEPALRAERILMVDFASTQSQAKEVASSASREGGQAVAAAT
jgi:hypothetical protein